jgi:hypothetical protein
MRQYATIAAQIVEVLPLTLTSSRELKDDEEEDIRERVATNLKIIAGLDRLCLVLLMSQLDSFFACWCNCVVHHFLTNGHSTVHCCLSWSEALVRAQFDAKYTTEIKRFRARVKAKAKKPIETLIMATMACHWTTSLPKTRRTH